jgi:malate dehydrogenase (oxaloacetate-decarboxylating)(NADP+)
MASKPVMEGKAVLFKRFADIDAVDVEVFTEDIEEFITVVKNIGRTWGGINLEDIKSPECFIIEKRLKELLDIPVFHDDQHGTAIITAAGLMNAAHITGRKLEDLKVVCNGAGAAGIACIELLKEIGVKHENVLLCDTYGVIYHGRVEGMNEWKEKHAVHTNARTLMDAMTGADVFLGLSVKGAVSQEMVSKMAPSPIIFAMANPDPEITPEEVKEVRGDAIVATGRSDYNNQVNNVMGFPYIFRGALDVRAKTINDEMKIAAAYAIAGLARQPVPDSVVKAYGGKRMEYGPEYIIPSPFDPRLMISVPLAVAKAALQSGVAQDAEFDLKQYRKDLFGRLNPGMSYASMVYDGLQHDPQRVIFADGEEIEVIKAAANIVSSGNGIPILVGRVNKIEEAIMNFDSEISLDGIEIINAAVTDKVDMYIDFLYAKLQREGYRYRDCAKLVKSDRNIFAACVLFYGGADCMVTGINKSYCRSLTDIMKVINHKPNHMVFSYSIMLAGSREIIIADSNVHELPSAEELVEIAIQTAKIARNIGYEPRVAFLSYSNFGNPNKEKSQRIRDAVKILDSRDVDFEYDGEMSPEIALNEDLMKSMYPFCRLSKSANVLIMPALHTASISTLLMQEIGGASLIGPVLTGLERSVQIVHMASNSENIMNFAAFAALEALNTGKMQNKCILLKKHVDRGGMS